MKENEMPELDLPAAERDVLACLHRLGGATSRQARDTLAGFRPMAQASVVALLKRLESKGLVAKQKGPVGKAFLYRACQAGSATLHGWVRQFVQRVFHDDSVAMVSSSSKPGRPLSMKLNNCRIFWMSFERKRERKNANEFNDRHAQFIVRRLVGLVWAGGLAGDAGVRRASGDRPSWEALARPAPLRAALNRIDQVRHSPDVLLALRRV